MSFEEAQEAGEEHIAAARDLLRDLKAGRLDKDGYLAALRNELAAVDDAMECWKEDKQAGICEPEECTEALYQLREAKKELRDFIKDAPYQAEKAKESRDDRWAEGDRGKWCRFNYTDAEGRDSKRELTMWESRGRYIVGFDRKRGEERTFRKVRISDWISG